MISNGNSQCSTTKLEDGPTRDETDVSGSVVYAPVAFPLIDSNKYSKTLENIGSLSMTHMHRITENGGDLTVYKCVNSFSHQDESIN